MSARAWMTGAAVVALSGFAFFLLRETRREPGSTVAPPPAARDSPRVGAQPVIAPPPPPAARPQISSPGELSIPPRSEIPARPPPSAPPKTQFVREQKKRALSMLNGEIDILEGDQRRAEQSGDPARARDLGVRLDRLRARKVALDEELRGAPPP